MTIKNKRTQADGTISSLEVVGFHGRLGVDQTPARRAPVYADSKGHLVRILEASPYGTEGKHTLRIEVGSKQISEQTWASTGTRVSPPWPAKLGDHVVIVGDREINLAAELVARINADTPKRVAAFLRWIITATDRSEELRCARVDGVVAWYTNADEIRGLYSQIAVSVRGEVVRCAQRGELRELASKSFWLSRAAVDDSDMFLAVAGLRHAGSPHWKMVLDAGVRTGSEKQRLEAVDEALLKLLPKPSLARQRGARLAVTLSLAYLPYSVHNAARSAA
jgi:hypothetical protein